MRAAASCKTIAPTVEKVSVQSKVRPYAEPATEQVVTVPGPMNAAEIIDQNKILPRPDRSESFLMNEELRVKNEELKVKN